MLTREMIGSVVARYEIERPKFEKVGADASRLINDALDRAAIRHMVTWRAKRPTSLRAKLWRERQSFGEDAFDGGLAPPLKDLAGVRALLYLPGDLDAAVEALRATFPGAKEKEFSAPSPYRAWHLQTCLKAHNVTGAVSALDDVGDLAFEIQVCTLTDHVWNELEHDIKYKQPDGKPDERQEELLVSLRQELDLTTSTLGRLMVCTRKRGEDNRQAVETADDLRRYVENRSGHAAHGDFGDLLGLLALLLEKVDHAALDRLAEGQTDTVARATASQDDPHGAFREAGIWATRFLSSLGPAEVLEQVDAAQNPPPLWRFLAVVARRALNG